MLITNYQILSTQILSKAKNLWGRWASTEIICNNMQVEYSVISKNLQKKISANLFSKVMGAPSGRPMTPAPVYA